MKRILGLGLVALALGACDGKNPLTDPAASGLDLLPGTDTATASTPITRYEAQSVDGNGYAQAITYDATADTFTVDNLAFDGANAYARDNVVANLGPFRVYENDSVYFDDVTGAPINQMPHKAIFGESTSGNTRFAIVRTGAFLTYGFGGFMYERDGGVNLPTTGQATFTGKYGGLRDFNGRAELEYVTGDMAIDIDFADFNTGAGVRGTVTNRAILDVNGVDVTASVTGALGVTTLPVLDFLIEPGVASDAGEMTGSVSSYVPATGGGVTLFESGKYYAVLSGDSAEIVGVIVVEATDARYTGVTVRETGGFILYR